MNDRSSSPTPACPECVELCKRIAELEAVVRSLQERLNLNSSNSSIPPSANPLTLPSQWSRPRAGANQAVKQDILDIIAIASHPSGSTKLLGARQLVRRFRDQAACPIDSANARSGNARSRRQLLSSPLRRAASNGANASTPCGDQLVP